MTGNSGGTARPLRVSVPGSEPSSYAVIIESGALRDLGRHVGEAVPAHRYALVADSRVAELYA